MSVPTGLLQTESVPLSSLVSLADAGQLHVLLDACDAPDVPVKVRELGEARAVSLYRGLPEERFESFAPYLVHADRALLDWIEATLWHEPWGVLVQTAPRLIEGGVEAQTGDERVSAGGWGNLSMPQGADDTREMAAVQGFGRSGRPAVPASQESGMESEGIPASPLDRLRSHFRRFLTVNSEQGREMYFRFYDPRVLRKYLSTCTFGELRTFYGRVQAFYIPTPTPNPTAGAIVERVERVVEVDTLSGGAASLSAPGAFAIGQRWIVRDAQMAAFAPEGEAAFEARVVAHLREHHAETVAGLPEATLRDMVRVGLARARHYGLTWESNLTAWVALMFEVAPNWDQHPRIHEILTNPRILPDKKLDAVIAQTPEPVWLEAAKRYDAMAWLGPAKGAA